MESPTTDHRYKNLLIPQDKDKKGIVKSESVKELERLVLEELIEKHSNFSYAIKPQDTDWTTNDLTNGVIDYIMLRGFQVKRINSASCQINNLMTLINTIGNIHTIGSVKWMKFSRQVGMADISVAIKAQSFKIGIKYKVTDDKYQCKGQSMLPQANCFIWIGIFANSDFNFFLNVYRFH